MRRHHTSTEIVTLLEELRGAAADVVAMSFKRSQKCVEALPGFHRYAVTRAVKSENPSPLFVVAGWAVALVLAGRIDRAQLLADFIQDAVGRARAGRPGDVSTASIAEQREEAHETSYQIEYGHGNRSVRAQWSQSLRRERALIGELLYALDAEEAAERRIAA